MFFYFDCNILNKNSVYYNKNNYYHMESLTKQYENAKQKSIQYMQKGQIGAYVAMLMKMNKYKKLMLITVAN